MLKKKAIIPPLSYKRVESCILMDMKKALQKHSSKVLGVFKRSKFTQETRVVSGDIKKAFQNVRKQNQIRDLGKQLAEGKKENFQESLLVKHRPDRPGAYSSQTSFRSKLSKTKEFVEILSEKVRNLYILIPRRDISYSANKLLFSNSVLIGKGI